MKLVIALVFALSSTAAFALTDKVYHCPNSSVGLPDNTYDIRNVNIGTDGVSVPYIEVSRYYLADAQDPNSKVEHFTMKGFASISTKDQTEILAIQAVRLEFVNGVLGKCK